MVGAGFHTDAKSPMWKSATTSAGSAIPSYHRIVNSPPQVSGAPGVAWPTPGVIEL